MILFSRKWRKREARRGSVRLQQCFHFHVVWSHQAWPVPENWTTDNAQDSLELIKNACRSFRSKPPRCVKLTHTSVKMTHRGAREVTSAQTHLLKTPPFSIGARERGNPPRAQVACQQQAGESVTAGDKLRHQLEARGLSPESLFQSSQSGLG